MSIKKFEAYGFKSFADKTDIIFEDGITCIVGPNGCGKSNVSDAIRWVLGEQSAKQLRGKGMQDLIFNGTATRKSMGYCEVSLYFDNSKKIFPLEYDEVVISRKLYRSGESEYYINKQSTKLKIISDLLRDVGLGREGYSIVSQGRMDAILNSKPEDRRAIFEEALGISKFRVRKNETERKLAKNSENMSRINDALKIYGDQLEPLRKQSEDAKKYLTLREQLKYHEVNSYIYSYDNANSVRERHLLKIAAISEECDYNESKYSQENAAYEDYLFSIGEIDIKISELSKQIADIRVMNERRTGERNLVSERVRSLYESVRSYSKDIEEAKSRSVENNIRIDSARSILKEQEAAYAEAVGLLQKKAEELSEISAKMTASEDEKSLASSTVLEILDGLSENKSLLASILSETGSAKIRLDEISKEEDAVGLKLKGLSDEEKNVINDYERAKSDVAARMATKTDLLEQENTLNARLSSAEINIEALKKNVMEKSLRLNMLKNIIERYEGFNPTVKRLMQDLDKSGLRMCIVGVLANLIKVSAQYETAISVALGAAVQNIVTNDENDAKRVIDYLKRNNLGRVTFMPLNAVKPRRFDDTFILSERGVLGVADKLITFDKKFDNIISSVLGATVIVDDYDNAVALSRKYKSSYRLVTLKGELFSNTGTITGGNFDRESNLLSYERESKEIGVALLKLNSELESAALEKESLLAVRSEIKARLAENERRLVDGKLLEAKAEEKIANSNALNVNEQQLVFKLSDEKRRINDRLNELDLLAVSYRAQIEALTARQNETVNVSARSQTLSEQFRALRETLVSDITGAKVSIAQLTAHMTGVKGEIEILLNQNIAAEQVFEQKSIQLEQARAALNQTENELSGLSVNGTEDTGLAGLEQQMSFTESQKQALNEKLSSCDKKRTALGVEILKLKELRNKETFNIEKIDYDLASMQSKILEDYDLTYSAAIKYKDEAYNADSSKNEINKLRNAISRLGNVNVSAIETYDDVKGKYDEIFVQMQDLEKAESDLNVILEELTAEMVKRFNEGFNKINENFGLVFSELFGGGKARLTIEKDPALDELSYGIEIEAQPPGKKLQSVMQLSGGERALTCIAILFAILRLNPMPFCVLDEIEAPLDDANALKVAKYIEKFAGDTQFVLITHKKPTMEVAKNLFGVTMEEKGVSKIISVKLTEAIAHSVAG